MKSERVTLLTTPDFKAFLTAEARREGVSVGQLVRARCEQRPTDDEATLTALTARLNIAVDEARAAMEEGLREARAVLAELRAARTTRADPVASQ
jgi:GAF domain-containing protein